MKDWIQLNYPEIVDFAYENKSNLVFALRHSLRVNIELKHNQEQCLVDYLIVQTT